MHIAIQHIYLLPLFISALLSLKSLRQQWPAPYKMVSVLLISVLLIEIMALLWKTYLYKLSGENWSRSNLWLYNSFLVPQYLLYIYIYHRVITSAALKRAIRIIGIVFPLLAIANCIWLQSIHSINSYTLVVASGIVVFLTMAYFEQLRKEKHVIQLTAHPMVWFSLGAFIFHAANLPFLISLNYLNRENVSLALSLFYIFLALNFLMYTFYSIAFLCTPPRKP